WVCFLVGVFRAVPRADAAAALLEFNSKRCASVNWAARCHYAPMASSQLPVRQAGWTPWRYAVLILVWRGLVDQHQEFGVGSSFADLSGEHFQCLLRVDAREHASQAPHDAHLFGTHQLLFTAGGG